MAVETNNSSVIYTHITRILSEVDGFGILSVVGPGTRWGWCW